MSPRTAPVTGTRVWVGAALVALAVLGGAWSLRELVAPGPWTAVSTLLVVSGVLVLGTLRSRSRSRTGPTAWATIGAVVVVVSLYGGVGTGPTLPVPTLETLRRITRLAQSGVTAIVDGRVPVEPTRGIELLVVLGVVAVLLLTDLVALGLGRAGLSGVFVAGLWAPVALFDRMPAFWVLVLCGTAYLLLLTLTRPAAATGGAQWWRDLLPAAGAGAAITALSLALGPVAAALPGYGAAGLPGGWGPQGIDGPLRLSTDLDMRASLAARSDRPLLRYTTTQDAPSTLRMYTMTAFDGTEWQRGGGVAEDPPTAGGLLWPSSDPLPVDPTVEEMAIQVGDLDQDRLPIPLEPREVDVSGRWLYDEVLDEVLSRGTTTRDTSFVVRISPRDLTADTLREDVAELPDGASPEALALPETPFVADVRARAEEITAEATNDYDRAVALQSYFRSAQNFVYSTQVPTARTDDAVYDFLTDRTGYCVQFATAMTVMARLLGMPARIGVGFLPGQANTEVRGEFVVTGRQSHAWPEIYFADAGWVRFEPTPAVQTGAPPVYADPNAGLPITAPTQTPTASASVQVTPGQLPDAQGGAGGGQVRIGAATLPLLLVVGITVLVVGGAVGTTAGLVARRRRRRVLRARRPEEAWTQLRRRLAAAGITWSDATTPRQAGAMLRPRYEGAAPTGLDRLVSAVETERYTPPRAVEWSSDELSRWVDEAALPFEEADRPVPVAH